MPAIFPTPEQSTQAPRRLGIVHTIKIAWGYLGGAEIGLRRTLPSNLVSLLGDGGQLFLDIGLG